MGFIPSAQNMILLARGVMVDLLNILSLSEKCLCSTHGYAY